MINEIGAQLLGFKFLHSYKHLENDLWIKPDGTCLHDVKLGSLEDSIVKDQYEKEFDLWKNARDEDNPNTCVLWEDCFLIDSKKWCHYSCSLKYIFFKNELSDAQKQVLSSYGLLWT